MSDYRDANRDPITNEPGAHPVGTGVGAALGGAAAGAAAGAFGGPVGAVVGGVAGAVAGGLAGKAAAFGLVSARDANLQQHVTGKALDGLFLMIGEEERRIRSDPVATGSAILKKVFGGR